jgi:hypothetical protein
MKLTCKDCGKRYDYEQDEFCPKCGSYNQPKDSSVTKLEEELEGRFASRRTQQAAVNARHRARIAASDREDAAYERQFDARGSGALPHRYEAPPKTAARPTLRDVGTDLKNMARDLPGRPGGGDPGRTPPAQPAPGTRPRYVPRDNAPGGTPPRERQRDPGSIAAVIVFIIILINFLRILFRIL